MKNNLKKGFTVIELLVVIAIIGILAGTVVPKLLKEIRKATVAKVQHNLGVIRSRLSLDETLSDEFPDLYDGTNTDFLKTYSIEPTPAFSDKGGDGHGASLEVVYTRTNFGGWLYNRNLGEIYANLPDGAYTKDEEYEIWGGETATTSASGKTEQMSVVSDGENWRGIIGNTPTNTVTKTLKDGTKITTTVTNGNLKTFNKANSSTGVGIGTDKPGSGLDSKDSLRVDIDGEGENINEVVFTLDGLGGWFDSGNRNSTQINITAYFKDGTEATQSSYRITDTNSENYVNEFSSKYSFEIVKPVSYFTVTSGAAKDDTKSLGNGTYVLQNIELIKGAQD